MSGSGEIDTPGLHLGAQFIGLVDPDVAALVGVIRVRQQPADLLRKPPRDRDGETAPGSQDAYQFSDRGIVLGHVFENLGGDHNIEGSVRVRQGQCIAHDHLCLSRLRGFTGGAHRLQHGADLGQFLSILIESDHVGAAAIGLVAVSARTAADVDDLGSRSDAKPVVIHRQHGSSTAVTSRRGKPLRSMAWA